VRRCFLAESRYDSQVLLSFLRTSLSHLLKLLLGKRRPNFHNRKPQVSQLGVEQIYEGLLHCHVLSVLWFNLENLEVIVYYFINVGDPQEFPIMRDVESVFDWR